MHRNNPRTVDDLKEKKNIQNVASWMSQAELSRSVITVLGSVRVCEPKEITSSNIVCRNRMLTAVEVKTAL
jgi:hypothetical protein